MANVAHSTLTGSDLHELKGAAAAAVNTLPIANGSGSTAFSKLTASNLTGTGNPFGGQLFHVTEEYGTGTSVTLTASAWNTRALNTTRTNEISASLASNQITLPAGTYFIDAEIAGVNATHKAKLYNVTAGTDLINGLTVAGAQGFGGGSTSRVRGRFTIAGSTVFEIRHWVTNGSTSGGTPASSGLAEVYSDVSIWKVA